eukprot:TRINITY_DN7954_c0_g1_i1.p1 TRINITY_DN7954_c0_g1~~TRINITY_DN7954_c0_g1_i1.p1  ORF type:complete len:407 (-),score=69.72 TRINITY_DN7954_c0_g1_i1:120-1340(-)
MDTATATHQPHHHHVGHPHLVAKQPGAAAGGCGESGDGSGSSAAMDNGHLVRERALLKLLYRLKTQGDSDVCALLKMQDESLRQFYNNLKQLRQDGLIVFTGGSKGRVSLTPEGHKAVSHVTASGAAMFDSLRCQDCDSRGYHCTQQYPPLAAFDKVAIDRPRAKEEFDQWYMTPQQALHRITFIHSRGDLVNKRILVIGDDDLLGVAAGFTRLAAEVVVLEVDQRIIDFTNRVAKEYNLNLRAQTFDARSPLPDELVAHFDVFVSDPVETVEGCKVFISRGVTGLRDVGSTVYFGLTTLESDRKKWFDVQRLIFEMNFALTDVIRNFTEYPDPGWETKLPFWTQVSSEGGGQPTSVWYRSAFCRLEAIAMPKPYVPNKLYEGEWDFFLDDETWATTEEKIVAPTD